MQYLSYPELFKKYADRIRVELSYSSGRRRGGAIAPHLPSQADGRVVLPPLIAQMIAVQFQIWLTSGFGEYQVQTEMVKDNKHRSLLKAGSSYVHHVSAEELEPIQRWCEQVSCAIQQLKD